MKTKFTDVKTGTIPTDIAFHINDQLEIPDVVTWAEASGMREQFRKKILHAKPMHKSLESLELLNAAMIEKLAKTDFRLKFSAIQRLIPKTESHSNLDLVTLDEYEDTVIMEGSFEFMGLGEDEILIEVRPTSDDEPQEFHRRHISDLT